MDDVWNDFRRSFVLKFYKSVEYPYPGVSGSNAPPINSFKSISIGGPQQPPQIGKRRGEKQRAMLKNGIVIVEMQRPLKRNTNSHVREFLAEGKEQLRSQEDKETTILIR
jgi:hypothetical protein